MHQGNNKPVDPGWVIQHIKDFGLQPPEMLTLMITDRCNLQCRHCWLDCRPNAATAPVPVNVVCGIIEDFARLGGTGVSLTGGEALTHPDWFEILAFTCSQSAFAQVCLQTNAMLVTPEVAAKIKLLDSVKLSIQISIDGASAEAHDLVRGEGSFHQTMRGLQCLVDAGMGSQIRVAFTEMRHNIAEVGDLMERLESHGIGELVSGTLVKGGRARRTNRLDLPSPAQYEKIIDRYQSDTAFSNLYDKMGNIAAIEWYKGRSVPTDRVCTCIKTPFVTAKGRMYPCVMLLVDKYGIEGVHRQPMADAILGALPLWAELPEIERSRREALDTCRACPGEAHCAGGCMGRAYAAYGDLMEAEDRCALRQAVYCKK